MDTFIAAADGITSVRSTRVGRTVLEMTEAQMRDFAEKNPSLLVEEDEALRLFAMPGLPERVPTEGRSTQIVQVKDANSGKPVRHVVIYGIGDRVAYRAVTNAKGQATLEAFEPRLSGFIASPQDSYWSQIVGGADISDKPISIMLKPLMVTGAYDWGHRLMGFRVVNQRWTGSEVKIGIIDSGITDRHEDLKPTSGHNALDGQDPNTWNKDEKGHGTHVGGIVAAVNNQIGISGAALNSQIYSLKVFPGGYNSDLVEAVEWCIHNRMDVISMSLGMSNPSLVLAGVLRDAYDRGITCVAATGNDSGPVAFPAAFPTVIGVGAIGRLNTFPEDSAHMLKVGQFRDRHGGLFSANFSNYGPEVDLCAPGVAILSTVPTGYAAWDGTSMACPLVSGLIALVLEAYPTIRTGDPLQTETVKSILFNACVDLGMPPLIQGRGLPLATRALAGARTAPAARVGPHAHAAAVGASRSW
jgi:subtilisin family serine protease